jgi:hypothetical protein
MKTLSATEMRSVEGGYSTSCPICGKSVSVFWLSVLLLGQRGAYAKAQAEAQARHYSIKNGYKKNVTHY